MATESMQRLLETPFEGRVVSQVDDPNSKYTDFDGNPTILYPWSEEGLRHAVRLREALGENAFLRSGLSSSGDGRRPAEGGLVVDLSNFCDIEVTKTKAAADVDHSVAITVGAAAKNSQLADELVRANAFLPLGDNPVKSVVSSLLSEQPGYFERSMGPLRDYVDELQVITPEGDVARVEKGDGDFDSVLDGDFGGVIKTIAFSAVPASREAVHVTRASSVYTHDDFDAALGLLRHEDVSETMDLSVHAHHYAYGLGLVSVTVAGRPEDDDRIRGVVDRLMSLHRRRQGKGWSARRTERMVQRLEARSPAEIVELILEGGLSGNPYVDRNLVCTHHHRVVPLDELDSFRASFMEDLVNTLGGNGAGAAPDVLGSVRSSLGAEGNVVVNADVFLPRAQTEAETEVARFADKRLGAPIQSRPHLAALKRYRGKRVPDFDASVLMRAIPPLDARVIPGFGGEIYALGDPDYDDKRKQYASSSYPDKQQPGGSMRPYLVGYPRKGTGDVGAAIAFAKARNKRVVARSGGHQYSGLSSGGDDTILLSMDNYKDIHVEEVGGKTYARVGVGARLTDVAAEFAKQVNRVTIPHGECPLVALGGHVQTGGYGHILRSYGLAIDHVHEFEIYLHDGESKVVRRPDAPDENSLYWAVLGGGPGSFGVLTEITFECIRDADHPGSWGSAKTFVYGRNLFLGAMKEIRRWTEQIAGGSADLPPDVDLCVTVVNGPLAPGWGLMLLEMVNGNKDGGSGAGNRSYLLAAQQRILSHRRWWNRKVPCRGYEGGHALSFMSNRKVRREGTTEDGREFKEPYEKRLNCTKQPLSTAFVEDFVDLVDRVVSSRTVKLVFQMFLGGGAYASPEPLSSICHRDITLGIVFDCFYKGNRGLTNARKFQAQMQDLLAEFSGDQEIRMLWGSFGDTDIGKEEVRKLYYDDATWSSLQKVKKREDAGDLFHTEFTVQLP